MLKVMYLEPHDFTVDMGDQLARCNAIILPQNRKWVLSFLQS